MGRTGGQENGQRKVRRESGRDEYASVEGPPFDGEQGQQQDGKPRPYVARDGYLVADLDGAAGGELGARLRADVRFGEVGQVGGDPPTESVRGGCGVDADLVCSV